MPFVAIAGVAKLEVLFHDQGFDGVNVLHVGGLDTTDAGAIADLAMNAAAAYQSTILGQKTSAFVLDAMRATSLDTVDGPQATSVANESGGRATATPMTPERCMVVQLRTALRGPSHRGRVYDNGYADDQAAINGSVSTTSRNQISQLWLDFRSALRAGGTGPDLVVVSYKLGLANPVIDCTVADVVGLQRRRIRA